MGLCLAAPTLIAGYSYIANRKLPEPVYTDVNQDGVLDKIQYRHEKSEGFILSPPVLLVEADTLYAIDIDGKRLLLTKDQFAKK